ncbi:LamG domain-containing protein [Pontibacter qinzhouensis]|uniref:LamG domain-containing protein n=1 Tax=Pontibacter qinzhouensis TaxID=2603253 RepID=A0A5C8IZN5_9BACT|nr:LamG domain-containing protein [Pontibacter qinzhouensis]
MMMKRTANSILILFFLHSFAAVAFNNPGEAPGSQKEAQVLFHLDFDKGFEAEARGRRSPVNSSNRPATTGGIKGKAVSFTPGQVLQYASSGNLQKQEGTIAMWLRLPPGSEGRKGEVYTLFNEDGPENAGSNSLKIELYKDRFIRFSIKDPKDSYIFYHKIEDWQQEWHHVAFTWNIRKGASIYVDGKPASIGWMPQWQPATYNSFFIGAANAKGERASLAAIDEFSIYNRELTEAEAREAFLRFREFTADVTMHDPFVTAASPAQVPVVLANAGQATINLKELRFELTGNSGKVLQQGKLPDQTLKGLEKSKLTIELAANPAGTYQLSLYYKEKGMPKKAQSPVHVLAVAEKAKAQEAKQVLVAEVDAVSQKPVGEFGGTTLIQAPIGAYREAGAKQRDRFAMAFEVEEANEPHLAVISYPDDKPRTMEVLLQDFGNNIDFQAHTGVFTGEEYPLSHNMQEHRIVFWPRSKKQAFIFMTAEPDYPAAVQHIKIYKIQHFKVTDAKNRFSGTVPARSTGLYYEDPVLFHNFGTGRDLAGFTKATDRLLQYMQSFGQTELEYPLAWYAGPLYGTAVEPFQPDIDGAQGGQRPHPDGYPAYLLKRLGEQQIKFTAGLHIHTLPSLNKYALADTALLHTGEETVININKDGKLWYGYWHGADPNYNPADPRVMASVTNIVTELCERYAQEPAFDGISLVMARPKLFTFGSLASGYNDSNLKRFQEEAGLRIPVYKAGDPTRFNKSYTWLMNNPAAKKAWIDWRCKVLYEHYASLGRHMATYRPDLKLKLNVFVHLTHNQRLADYLTEPSVEVMREMGIDPELYKNHPNIVFNYTTVPADMRWKRNNFPPANHEVNRTVMTAPEVVASLKDHEKVRVTIHDRYWEDPIGKEAPLAGLKALGVNEMVWRASTLNAVGYHSMEPYVFALHHLDATSLVKGGYVVGTFGMEEELSQFSRALQAFPAVKFDDVPAVADPVRIRQKVVDGKLYFYVLNTLPEPAQVTINLTHADRLMEPAIGTSTKKTRKVKLSLKPYELRVFTSNKGQQAVAGGDVRLPKEFVNGLRSKLETVQKLAREKGMDKGKLAPYLELAAKTWDNKHYSRLYFLLQEDWAAALLAPGTNPDAASRNNP